VKRIGFNERWSVIAIASLCLATTLIHNVSPQEATPSVVPVMRKSADAEGGNEHSDKNRFEEAKPTRGVAASTALKVPSVTESSSARTSNEASLTPEDWVQSVVKIIAEGGVALVSMAFAAFAFLYGALVAIIDSDSQVTELRNQLRKALYGTAFAVILSTGLTILACFAMVFKLKSLGFIAIGVTVVILLVLSAVTSYLAYCVFREK
jgi:hypothetical protein